MGLRPGGTGTAGRTRAAIDTVWRSKIPSGKFAPQARGQTLRGRTADLRAQRGRISALAPQRARPGRADDVVVRRPRCTRTRWQGGCRRPAEKVALLRF